MGKSLADSDDQTRLAAYTIQGAGMTYRGRVQHGTVILDNPGALPEGTEVEVAPVTTGPQQSTWADVFKDVIGKAEGLPDDSSRNHDHHLYGTNRK